MNAFIDYDCSIRSNTLNDLYRDWCFGLVAEKNVKLVDLLKIRVNLCLFQKRKLYANMRKAMWSNTLTNQLIGLNPKYYGAMVKACWARFLNDNQRHLWLMSIFFLINTQPVCPKRIAYVKWHGILKGPFLLFNPILKLLWNVQSFEKLIRSMKNLFENVEKSIGSNEFFHCELWFESHNVKIKIRRFSKCFLGI